MSTAAAIQYIAAGYSFGLTSAFPGHVALRLSVDALSELEGVIDVGKEAGIRLAALR